MNVLFLYILLNKMKKEIILTKTYYVVVHSESGFEVAWYSGTYEECKREYERMCGSEGLWTIRCIEYVEYLMEV